MSDNQSNTSSSPVDSTQGGETVILEVDRQTENSTNTGEVVPTEQETQEEKDRKVHQLVESWIGKEYTKPSDEERREFERRNDIARLRASRLRATTTAGHTSGTCEALPQKIQEEETRLEVTWIPDDFHPDRGYYKDKDKDTEYKDFVGDPCAGGSGGIPCGMNPVVYRYTCGEIDLFGHQV